MNLDPALALAFMNTTPSSDGRPGAVSAPGDLWAWLDESGLVPGVPRPGLPQLRELLNEGLRLRGALAHLVTAWTQPGAHRPPLALLEVNRVLEALPSRHATLTADAQGYALLHHSQAHTTLGLLAPIAEAGALLLATEDPRRVRRCAAPDCGQWYLDSSKNQRRRWCSMAVCGNRSKVAAHHRRHRGQEG